MQRLYKNLLLSLWVQKIKTKSCLRPPDHPSWNNTVPAVISSHLRATLGTGDRIWLLRRWQRSKPHHRASETSALKGGSILSLVKSGTKVFIGKVFIADIIAQKGLL